MEPLELVLFALHLQGVSSVHTCGKRPFIPCVEACICTYIYVGLQPRSQGLFPPLAKEKGPGNKVGRAGSHMQILGFVVAFASAFAWHVWTRHCFFGAPWSEWSRILMWFIPCQRKAPTYQLVLMDLYTDWVFDCLTDLATDWLIDRAIDWVSTHSRCFAFPWSSFRVCNCDSFSLLAKRKSLIYN